MRRTDRTDDETHRCWLRLRQEGHPIADIARGYEVKPEKVRVALGRIRADYAISTGGVDDVYGAAG